MTFWNGTTLLTLCGIEAKGFVFAVVVIFALSTRFGAVFWPTFPYFLLAYICFLHNPIIYITYAMCMQCARCCMFCLPHIWYFAYTLGKKKAKVIFKWRFCLFDVVVFYLIHASSKLGACGWSVFFSVFFQRVHVVFICFLMLLSFHSNYAISLQDVWGTVRPKKSCS